ncbi:MULTISPECIES: hypothetical protein [unclassified Streptomyces]|uniref:hypothetical protein n=1 Tax=unclassified Streptomyces TaxID=2593676 RepID=UPI0036FF3455
MSARKSPASSNGAGPSPVPGWLVRAAAVVGRPAVLAAALTLSAPGEYRLALLAGWTPAFAYVMPLIFSLYAAVGAAIAGSLPRSSPERRQANMGAVLALLLAMTAQVVSHLIEAGYMAKGPLVVVAVSAVPPLVAAHTLHLASVRPLKPVRPPQATGQEAVTVNVSRGGTPPWKPSTPKWSLSLSPPTQSSVSAALTAGTEEMTPGSPQKPAADQIVRQLYDDLGGKRPATRHIVDALRQAGLPHSDGTAREARKRVETKEPELRALPPA